MKDSVHLVVGGSGGIGTALVRRLVAEEARVIAFARDESRLRSLAEETGARVETGDARNAERLAEIVKRVIEEYGRLDGAVCLAGSIVLKPAHGTTSDVFLDVLQQNLLTAFHLVRAAAPAMGRAGGGSLVLMSSAAARIGLPNHEAIAAAKAGVEGLARSAAASYANRNVRVNVVAPGLVRTPLSEALTSSPKSLEASQAMHPLGRIGEPDEVASLIAWLLSQQATWTSGQTFGMDGGLSQLAPRR